VRSNQKPADGKWAKDRANAQRFLWHLCSPWKDKFSHEHWWRKWDEPVYVEAALWELFRRHPDVPMIMQRHRAMEEESLRFTAKSDNTKDFAYYFEVAEKVSQLTGSLPGGNLYLLSLSCCKTWPMLGVRMQHIWKNFLDTRMPKYSEYVNHSVIDLTSEASMDKIEEYRRKGMMILAIDPRAPGVGREAGMKIALARNNRHTIEKGKARVQDWFDIISEFETDYTRLKRGKVITKQLFTRYRNVLSKKIWPW
jgi:hypothetical protein